MYSLDVKSNVIHTAVILKVMTSIVHGPIDITNPFDLTVQTFRVNVEFFTDYHGHTQKIFSSQADICGYFFKNFVSKFFRKMGIKRPHSNQCLAL